MKTTAEHLRKWHPYLVGEERVLFMPSESNKDNIDGRTLYLKDSSGTLTLPKDSGVK